MIVPSDDAGGQVGYKLDFYRGVLDRVQQLRRRCPVLVTEDCITAHRKIDLAHLKSNLRNSGLLPEVRAGLDRRLGGGWVTALARIFWGAKPVTAPIGRDCYNAVAFQPSKGAGSHVPNPDR